MNKKQRLRKKGDDLWKDIILSRHDYRCEICGEDWKLTAHHFYFRSSYGHLRFDLDNGISLCGKCHASLHRNDQKKMEQRIEKLRGDEWKETLKEKAIDSPQGSYMLVGWYEDHIKRLKENPL